MYIFSDIWKEASVKIGWLIKFCKSVTTNTCITIIWYLSRPSYEVNWYFVACHKAVRCGMKSKDIIGRKLLLFYLFRRTVLPHILSFKNWIPKNV